MPMRFRGPVVTDTAIAAALLAKGLTDAQARTALGSASSVAEGLRGLGLMRAVPSPTPTPPSGSPITQDFGGATMKRSANGGMDQGASATYTTIAGDIQTQGYMAGSFAMIVRGTDATFASANPDGTSLEVSVDDGPFAAAPLASGRNRLFAGLSDGDHKVVLRGSPASGTTQGFGHSVADVLRVTGVTPGVQSPDVWHSVLDPAGYAASGHVVMNNRLLGGNANIKPQKVRFVSDQSSPELYEQVQSLTIRGEYTSLWIVSRVPWVAVSIDGAGPTFFDLGPNRPALKIITGLSGIHTYTVSTSKGADGTGPVGANLFAVGGTLAVGGRQTVSVRRFDQYGDSITEGVAPSSSPVHTDCVRIAAALGRQPSNYGLAGATIVDVRNFIINVLARKTVTSADMAVLASGRNNPDTLPQSDLDAYADSCNRLLAAGYGLVLARGVTPGSWPTRNAQIKAVVEGINNPRLKYIDPTTWTGIPTGNPGDPQVDGVHPSDAGYVKLADEYALPAYRAAGAT